MKTIKSYIKKIKEIEKISPSFLKGWDKLTDKQKNAIELMSANISNDINDYYELKAYFSE